MRCASRKKARKLAVSVRSIDKRNEEKGGDKKSRKKELKMQERGFSPKMMEKPEKCVCERDEERLNEYISHAK